MTHAFRAALRPLLLSELALFVFLTGCGVAPSSSIAPSVIQGNTIKGRVMGGQQPVAGSLVQLWAASSAGYAAASTPLISDTVKTSDGTGVGGNASNGFNAFSRGSFSITGEFTCPTPANTPVYLTVTGGDPGGGTNANLALMTALGPCSGLASIPFVNVNELTTVASVWALSPFMSAVVSGSTNSAVGYLGTSSTNAMGLVNAMAAVNKLVNIATGDIGGPLLPGGATLPRDEMYELGNVLAACVNSQGGLNNDGSLCGNLFHLTTSGAKAPTDTITAAMYLAQNPSLNASQIFNTTTGVPVFATNMTVAPAAWTIAVNYTGGGLKSPRGIAVDASGNVWTANSGNSSVTKLGNSGAAVSGSSGYTAGSVYQPAAITIDASGFAWVANANNSGTASLTQLSLDGSTGAQITGNSLSAPKSLAVDSAGQIWVSNSGNNSASVFTALGGAVGNYTGGGVTAPVGIAVNPQ